MNVHLHIFIAYDWSLLGLPVGYSGDEGGWGPCEEASPRKELEFCFDPPFDPQSLNLGLWADRCSGIFHHVSVCRHGWFHENSLDIWLLKYVQFPICVHKYWEKTLRLSLKQWHSRSNHHFNNIFHFQNFSTSHRSHFPPLANRPNERHHSSIFFINLVLIRVILVLKIFKPL